MSKPLRFSQIDPVRATSGALPEGSRIAGPGGCPAPRIVCFEIGVILALTLAIACAVLLVLSVFGIE